MIIQNRRFLLLTPKGQAPNLASQALGAALRALPGQWRDRFGYTPLLAESFTDPEAYAETCYKASNWEAVGYSAGYSRHRADFYLPNDRPKRLWLRPLSAQARQTLRAAQLPEGCRAGLSARPMGTLPVNVQRVESLLEVFCEAPDPRKKNAHYPVGPVLTLIGLAAQEGHRRLSSGSRLQCLLPGAHPHGSRSLRFQAHRLVARAGQPAAAGAGLGRQNDSSS